MAEYREAFFRNAATPNIVIKYQDKIAPERVERLQTRLRERNTGMDGAFSTLILDQGADMMVVGQDMVGSAFDDLQAAGETRILMAAGVPPVVAGARQGLQASEVGEYAVGLRALADMTIRPNWRGACAALEKLVQMPPGAQLWIDTTDVSALQQGEQDKAATSQQQAATIAQLIMNGFDPDSVVAAVVAGDMTLLEHTGAMSVQVQPMPAGPMGEPPADQQPEPADPGGTDD
jgi:phage portal protein BeeE